MELISHKFIQDNPLEASKNSEAFIGFISNLENAYQKALNEHDLNYLNKVVTEYLPQDNNNLNKIDINKYFSGRFQKESVIIYNDLLKIWKDLQGYLLPFEGIKHATQEQLRFEIISSKERIHKLLSSLNL